MFLVYNEVNQLHVYIYPPSLNPTSRLPQSTELSSCIFSSFPLATYFTYGARLSVPAPIIPSSSPPLCVYMSVFYIWVSIPALEIDLWFLKTMWSGEAPLRRCLGQVERGWQRQYLGERTAPGSQGGAGWGVWQVLGSGSWVSPPWRSWRPPRGLASLCSNVGVLSRDI